MEKEYKYLISYNVRDKDGGVGFGHVVRKGKEKFDTESTIAEWIETFEKDNGYKSVIIMNIMPLRK